MYILLKIFGKRGVNQLKNPKDAQIPSEKTMSRSYFR
jgi:hypothetical protein